MITLIRTLTIMEKVTIVKGILLRIRSLLIMEKVTITKGILLREVELVGQVFQRVVVVVVAGQVFQ